jgi:hypothetical protein
MSRVVDNLIAYKVLSMMVQSFVDTPAYKLGIIDEKGHALKKASQLKTSEEKDSYTYLTRLVFNMKRIINKIGGENKLKSIVAALFLIKEYYEKNDRSTSLMEERFIKLLESNAILAEETILVEKYINEEAYCDSCDRVKSKCVCDKEVDEEAPTNSTGAGVSTDQPVIRKSDLNKYKKKNQGVLALARRLKKV